MRKYENVDVNAVLGAITDINTENYKSDFRYDVERFGKEADKEPAERENFYWLSRKSGTCVFGERESHIKDSEAYNHFMYYAGDSKYDSFLTYAAEITGRENGRVMGNLYEINVVTKGEWLKKNAIPAESVTLGLKDGGEKTISHDEYNGANFLNISGKYGEIERIRYEPGDEASLRSLIAKSRLDDRAGCRAAKFNVTLDSEHLKKLEIGIADKEMPGKPLKHVFGHFGVYYNDGRGYEFEQTVSANRKAEYRVRQVDIDGETGEKNYTVSAVGSDAYGIADKYINLAYNYARANPRVSEVPRGDYLELAAGIEMLSKASRDVENYLKTAEMSTEDDYGMIDGIINNGTRNETDEKKGLLDRLGDMKEKSAAGRGETDAPERGGKGHSEQEAR